jgi:hypothetical protein
LSKSFRAWLLVATGHFFVTIVLTYPMIHLYEGIEPGRFLMSILPVVEFGIAAFCLPIIIPLEHELAVETSRPELLLVLINSLLASAILVMIVSLLRRLLKRQYFQ